MHRLSVHGVPCRSGLIACCTYAGTWCLPERDEVREPPTSIWRNVRVTRTRTPTYASPVILLLRKVHIERSTVRFVNALRIIFQLLEDCTGKYSTALYDGQCWQEAHCLDAYEVKVKIPNWCKLAKTLMAMRRCSMQEFQEAVCDDRWRGQGVGVGGKMDAGGQETARRCWWSANIV